jgi:hypothetical protein
MAWELCSKEEVISIHHAPLDALPDLWSDVVEDLIRTHLGAEYYGTSQPIIAETHSGDNTNILLVRKPPIISVEELRVSAIALVSTGYVIFPNHVALRAQNFPEGTLNVQIDYTSGKLTVKPSVKMAAIAMIAAIMNYRGRYGADSSIKWGVGNQQVGEENPNIKVGLTSHLSVIMKRMLRREKVRAS